METLHCVTIQRTFEESYPLHVLLRQYLFHAVFDGYCSIKCEHRREFRLRRRWWSVQYQRRSTCVSVPAKSNRENKPIDASSVVITSCRATSIAAFPPILWPIRIVFGIWCFRIVCMRSEAISAYVIDAVYGESPWLRISTVTTWIFSEQNESTEKCAGSVRLPWCSHGHWMPLLKTSSWFGSRRDHA